MFVEPDTVPGDSPGIYACDYKNLARIKLAMARARVAVAKGQAEVCVVLYVWGMGGCCEAFSKMILPVFLCVVVPIASHSERYVFLFFLDGVAVNSADVLDAVVYSLTPVSGSLCI